MAMNQASFRIRGVAPLLMNNIQKADPLNEHSKALKAVTKKRLKTDEDMAEIARIEWRAGLYLSVDGAPCIMGEAIEASIREGAKKSKQGKSVQSGLFIPSASPLIYDGPKDPEKMWDSGKFYDTRGVRVQSRVVMRTRPIFREWEIEFVAHYNSGVMSAEDIRGWLAVAGEQVGILDFRPRFGRYVLVQ